MRVEIVQEVDAEDDKLEIPWESPTDSRLRYVDLKSNPGEIGRLEEVAKYPALSGFLRKVNSPPSSFLTAKCDVWETTELTEEERLDFQLPHKVGSYLDVLFERPEFNSSLEHHQQLGEKLKQILSRLRVQAQMDVCVRRCLFRDEDRWGYYLTVFIHGYGATRAEAEEEWTRAIAAAGDALAGIDQVLRTLIAALPIE